MAAPLSIQTFSNKGQTITDVVLFDGAVPGSTTFDFSLGGGTWYIALMATLSSAGNGTIQIRAVAPNGSIMNTTGGNICIYGSSGAGVVAPAHTTVVNQYCPINVYNPSSGAFASQPIVVFDAISVNWVLGTTTGTGRFDLVCVCRY